MESEFAYRVRQLLKLAMLGFVVIAAYQTIWPAYQTAWKTHKILRAMAADAEREPPSIATLQARYLEQAKAVGAATEDVFLSLDRDSGSPVVAIEYSLTRRFSGCCHFEFDYAFSSAGSAISAALLGRD